MTDNMVNSGYITELQQTDVLFGRGSGPNDHEGNIRFRQLVADRKGEYLSTNHRQTKARIAREIVNSVLIEHGRFLKKVEHADARRLGIPKGIDAWIMVDQDTVMEKAKQALRQNTNKLKMSGDCDRTQAVCAAVASLPARATTASSFPMGIGSGNNNNNREHQAVRPIHTGSLSNQSSNMQQIKTGQFQELDSYPVGVGSGANVNNQAVQPTPIGWGTEARPDPGWNNNAQGQGNVGVPSGGFDPDLTTSAGWNRSAGTQQGRAGLPARRDSETGSISLDDFSFKNSRGPGGGDMDDMMISFSRMRTNESKDFEHKFHESTDTMGTIEPFETEGNKNEMNLDSSITSSGFSILKGPMGESSLEIGGCDMSRVVRKDDSNLSDVWGAQKGSLLDRLIAEERAEANALAEEPRSFQFNDSDAMGNLGNSNIMRAFESTNGGAGFNHNT